MIATIEGIVDFKQIDRIILNVNGLGYEVFMSDIVINKITNGQKLKVYIYEQIKEDVHDLYGFISQEDKKLFTQLLSVKNVGPRVAMAVLNIDSASKIRQAIAGGDIALLQTAKGVGRRAAEQIVVELRDKIGLSSTADAEAIVARSADEISHDEAVQALVSLGYSQYDAKLALANIDTNLPIEERITQALKGAK